MLPAVSEIHPTAIIDSNASLGADCVIGPYCIVEAGVTLGERCRLDAHAVVRSGSELGEDVRVFSGAVIGGEPQDLTFDPRIPSRVVIGAGSVLREGVTVNRSLREGGVTRLGERVYMMAFSHAAHDCRLEEGVVLANGALLAGHVRVGAYAFIGGGAGIHQYCRIGEAVMVGGNASITKDIPPGLSVVDRNHLVGPNLVGLRRRGLSAEEIGIFKRTYRDLYTEPGNIREKARRRLEGEGTAVDLVRRFLAFFGEGTRGFAAP